MWLKTYNGIKGAGTCILKLKSVMMTRFMPMFVRKSQPNPSEGQVILYPHVISCVSTDFSNLNRFRSLNTS